MLIKSSDFRFETMDPMRGQCVFLDKAGISPIRRFDEIVGWANFFCSCGDKKRGNIPYFNLVVRRNHDKGNYTPVFDFKMHKFIYLYDRSMVKIFTNDLLYDHETESSGSIEEINGAYYFRPDNVEGLSSTGRKRLTNGLNWTIIGNSVDGSLI